MINKRISAFADILFKITLFLWVVLLFVDLVLYKSAISMIYSFILMHSAEIDVKNAKSIFIVIYSVKLLAFYSLFEKKYILSILFIATLIVVDLILLLSGTPISCGCISILVEYISHSNRIIIHSTLALVIIFQSKYHSL